MMNKNFSFIGKLLIVISLITTFFAVIPSFDYVYAEDVGGIESDLSGIGGKENKSKFQSSEGETLYYHLEADMPDDDKAFFLRIFTKAKEGVSSFFYETINFLNNLILGFNMLMTSLMMQFLSFAQTFDVFDGMINELTSQVSKITGVYSFGFGSGGVFNKTVLKVIALFTVIYAMYQIVWKRSMVKGFSEILKYIVVLALAFVLFNNYSSFVTSVNTISGELSSLFLSSGTNSTEESYNEKIWEGFIDTPYLYLQYGTDDVEEIGEDRIRELLLSPTSSPSRESIVENEVNELGNMYMTYGNTKNRTLFLLVITILNGITAIPVFIMSFALLFTHIWFLIIAMIAPFVLLIACIPTQFEILKRYLFELGLPLLVKIGLSFIILLMMSFYIVLLSQVHTGTYLSGGISSLAPLFIVAALNFVLFISVFILRKRIFGIFTSGTKMVAEVREGMRTMTEPVKKGTQAVATTTGVAVGAAMGGSAGAQAGANIGSIAGKAVTGEAGGIGNMAQDVSRAHYQTQVLKTLDQSPDNQSDELQQKPYRAKGNNNKVQKVDSFIEDNDLKINSKDLHKEMERQYVKNDEISDASLNYAKSYTDPEDNNYNSSFVRNLKEHKQKMKELKQNILDKRKKQFESILKEYQLNEREIESIFDSLEQNEISFASIPQKDVRNANFNIKRKLKRGEEIEYSQEFVKEIQQIQKQRNLKEQKERVLNANLKDMPPNKE